MSWSSFTEILTWNTDTEDIEMDNGSHTVVLVGPQPDDRTVPMTRIVTDTVSQYLWERDSTERWQNHLRLLMTLLKGPTARSFCGRGFFEPAFHELSYVLVA